MKRLWQDRLIGSAFAQVPAWLTAVVPERDSERNRIRTMERDLGLPVRVVTLLLLSSFFFFRWFEEMSLLREGVVEVVQLFFAVYLLLGALGGILIYGMDELPFAVVRETVLVLCIVDCLFLGALVVVTGGFDSILYWLFLGLIVRNAISVSLGFRQLVLNLIATACFVGAGITEMLTTRVEIGMLDPLTLSVIYPEGETVPAEPVLVRVMLLLLLSLCCYGVEVLFMHQRDRMQEARNLADRQHQLESAGRLAAEIAHRLKNPLGIINNAAFTLQRTVKEGKTITQQIKIIREEVDRSDKIITELMGYARLVEGQVERLDVGEELDVALERVFPPAIDYAVEIERAYASPMPPLHMLRDHFQEIIVNLLQNAREAMDGKGRVLVRASVQPGFVVCIEIEDDGPGIAPDALDKVFEPYHTSKDKGTGLGLAIVQHNIELYGGSIVVESELGKGTKFALTLPAKTSVRLRQ